MQPIFTKYPFDGTARNPDNKVYSEVLTHNDGVILLRAGTYYTESLVVYADGVPLDEHIDYHAAHVNTDAQEDTGFDCRSVVVLESPVEDVVYTADYHAVGGRYAFTSKMLQDSVDNLELNRESVQYGNIAGLPNAYSPTKHFHLMTDLVGAEHLVEAIDRVVDAAEKGRDADLYFLVAEINKKIARSEITPAYVHGKLMESLDNGLTLNANTLSGLTSNAFLRSNRELNQGYNLNFTAPKIGLSFVSDDYTSSTNVKENSIFGGRSTVGLSTTNSIHIAPLHGLSIGGRDSVNWSFDAGNNVLHSGADLRFDGDHRLVRFDKSRFHYVDGAVSRMVLETYDGSTLDYSVKGTLEVGRNGALRINNPDGVDYTQYTTTKNRHRFNEPVSFADVIRSENQDLILARGTSNKLTIAGSNTQSHQSLIVGDWSYDNQSVIQLRNKDTNYSALRISGASQGASYVEVGRSQNYAGGISYVGSALTLVNGEREDEMTFFRSNNGVRHAVFSYRYDNSTVDFRANVNVRTGTIHTSTTVTNENDMNNSPIVIHERNNVRNTESNKIYAPNLCFEWGLRNRTSLWMNHLGELNLGKYDDNGIPQLDGTFRANAIYQNGGLTWTNVNDGHGSGLDADLWDGREFEDYLNQGVRKTDTPIFNGITINQGDGVGKGISLHAASVGVTPVYGLHFSKTENFGTHGFTDGDWATYFTMSSSSGRGWIFSRSGTNVASISNDGDASFRNIAVEGGITSDSGFVQKGITSNTINGEEWTTVAYSTSGFDLQAGFAHFRVVGIGSGVIFNMDVKITSEGSFGEMTYTIETGGRNYCNMRIWGSNGNGWAFQVSGRDATVVDTMVYPMLATSDRGFTVPSTNIDPSTLGLTVKEELYDLKSGIYSNKTLYRDAMKAWYAGNDGAGSGMDADTLDGFEGHEFVRRTIPQTIESTLTFNYPTVFNTSIDFNANSTFKVTQGLRFNLGTNAHLKIAPLTGDTYPILDVGVDGDIHLGSLASSRTSKTYGNQAVHFNHNVSNRVSNGLTQFTGLKSGGYSGASAVTLDSLSNGRIKIKMPVHRSGDKFSLMVQLDNSSGNIDPVKLHITAKCESSGLWTHTSAQAVGGLIHPMYVSFIDDPLGGESYITIHSESGVWNYPRVRIYDLFTTMPVHYDDGDFTTSMIAKALPEGHVGTVERVTNVSTEIYSQMDDRSNASYIQSKHTDGTGLSLRSFPDGSYTRSYFLNVTGPNTKISAVRNPESDAFGGLRQEFILLDSDGSTKTHSNLRVNGILTVTGAIYETSDRNKKSNIEDISNPFDFYSAVKGKTFEIDGKGGESIYSAGVIAQDVQLFDSRLVAEEEGALRLNYTALHGYHTAAIEALIKDNESKEDRIKSLEDEVAKIKSMLSELNL